MYCSTWATRGTSPHWKGYVEYAADGMAAGRPRMWGFQAAGAAPIVNNAPVKNPSTIATAIRIGNPASWDQAVAAREESGGQMTPSPTERSRGLPATRFSRGGFVEKPKPSAASVAGLLKSHKAGLLDPGQTVTCTVTGNGL